MEKNILFENFKKYLLKYNINKVMLQELKKKYESYGDFRGNIKLKSINDEDKLFLERILNKKITGNEVNIKTRDYINFFSGTQYSSINFKDFLGYYFSISLRSKKEDKLKKKEEFENLINELIIGFGSNTSLKDWLLKQRDEKINLRLRKIINENPNKAKNMILDINKAEEILDKTEGNIRLAHLAALVNSNPHSFDLNEDLGSIFLAYLIFKDNKNYDYTQEARLELLYKNKILTDSISSFTTAYKITAYFNGDILKSYLDFNERGESYLISLSNLKHIDVVKSISKEVFIIENQMVYQEIIERLNGKDITVICTSGQLKVASLVLLDKLYESGSIFYYSGDMDPEGLIIAQKFLNRFNNSKLWFFDEKSFNKSKVNIKKILDGDTKMINQRFSKMDILEDETLLKIKELIINNQCFAYQEKLTGDMIKTMMEITKNSSIY